MILMKKRSFKHIVPVLLAFHAAGSLLSAQETADDFLRSLAPSLYAEFDRQSKEQRRAEKLVAVQTASGLPARCLLPHFDEERSSAAVLRSSSASVEAWPAKPEWCVGGVCEVKIAFIYDSDFGTPRFPFTERPTLWDADLNVVQQPVYQSVELLVYRMTDAATEIFRQNGLGVTFSIVAIDSNDLLATAGIQNYSSGEPVNGLNVAEMLLPFYRRTVEADIVVSLIFYDASAQGTAWQRLAGMTKEEASTKAVGSIAVAGAAVDQLGANDWLCAGGQIDADGNCTGGGQWRFEPSYFKIREPDAMSNTLAHELGHIFGLSHQHPDLQDAYVDARVRNEGRSRRMIVNEEGYQAIPPFVPSGYGYISVDGSYRSVMAHTGPYGDGELVFSDGTRDRRADARKALRYGVVDAAFYAGTGVPDPGAPQCENYSTSFWRGPGGFAVKPSKSNGTMEATVTIKCGGRERTEELFAGDDGLIVQLVPSRCTGALVFSGIDDGGWYWLDGERNAAVSPLVCAQHVTESEVVGAPEGVDRFVGSTGTLLSEQGTGFLGIVPHFRADEEADRTFTPFWRGRGGVYGSTSGDRVKMRVTCGSTLVNLTRYPDADGVVTSLIDYEFCFDGAGKPKVGVVEAWGFDPGAWYWLSDEGRIAVAPFMVEAGVGREPVQPREMEATVLDSATLFEHVSSDRLLGIVPRLPKQE